jgi:hypothetical protein
MFIVAVQYGNGCQRRNVLRMLRSVPPDSRLPPTMVTQLRRLQSHSDVETRELAVSVLRLQGWLPATTCGRRRGLRDWVCNWRTIRR